MLHDSSEGINIPQTDLDVEQQLDGLERHLTELQRQIEQLQRLASLGTMSAMLAHEFNNLLTPILSYCQYALQRPEPELLRTAVEKTYKNAQRLSLLCQRVLGMAVDDQMGPVETPLLPLVTETIECLGRDLGNDDITLTLDIPEGLRARVRASSFQQVLFNLVINARQAMLDRPGRLTISAQAGDEGRVAIEVVDTGPGIKPEHLDRIFEPFFTTKQHEGRPDRRGIGLGLHICRQLMEEQGGTIRAESKYGEGAKFTLTIPGVSC